MPSRNLAVLAAPPRSRAGPRGVLPSADRSRYTRTSDRITAMLRHSGATPSSKFGFGGRQSPRPPGPVRFRMASFGSLAKFRALVFGPRGVIAGRQRLPNGGEARPYQS